MLRGRGFVTPPLMPIAVISVIVLVGCSGGVAPAASPFVAVIPAFRGTTCDELADEFGRTADTGIRSVMEGPPVVGDRARSSMMVEMQGRLASEVSGRMIDLGIIGDCRMPDFLDRAQAGFSQRLRTGVGVAAYDGDPVIEYGAWLAELSELLTDLGVGKPSTPPHPVESPTNVT